MHIVCPHCESINRLPGEKLTANGKCGKCKKALLTGEVHQLNSRNFAKHIGRNEIPILVDFWAPWCGPCKTMAPAFTKAAVELQTQTRFAKVDTEAEQQLAAQFQIRSIPTLALFRDGKEIARTAGVLDLANLLNWVRQNTG